MRAKKVFLVLVDISGYTHFIRTQKMSAIHAEEIIFELLEAVIDRAAYPVTLNKLCVDPRIHPDDRRLLSVGWQFTWHDPH